MSKQPIFRLSAFAMFFSFLMFSANPQTAYCENVRDYACDNGDGEACNKLGLLYLRGSRHTKADAVKSVQYFMRACNVSYPPACFSLGLAYRDGKGIPQNGSLAVKALSKACDLGWASSCNSLGYMHEKGTVFDQSYEKAIELYRRACDGGSDIGCTNLKFVKLEQSCSQNDGRACGELGMKLGRTARPDFSYIAKVFSKGCELEDTVACTGLAIMLDRGKGVDANASRAAKLYEKACGKGNTTSCIRLGFLYRDGRGVEQDESKAAKIFQRSCSEDNPREACGYLGMMYEDGRGVKANRRLARKLLEGACNNGHDASCERLPDPDLMENVRSAFRDIDRALKIRVTTSSCKSYEYREASDFLNYVQKIFDENPPIARELEGQYKQYVARMGKISAKCFAAVVIPNRKGKCAETARTILRRNGSPKAKAASKGRYSDVLAIANVQCDEDSMRIHRENLEFVLKGCRFVRLECYGKVRSAVDFDWPALNPEDYLRTDPLR